MSLWAKAQDLRGDSFMHIRNLYGDHFPIEVRHCLAQYIEDNFLYSVGEPRDSPLFEQLVSNLINNLIQEIENKSEVCTDSGDFFLTKLKLAEAAKNFRQRYSTNPVQLYDLIQRNLSAEVTYMEMSGEKFQGMQMPLYVSRSASEICQSLEDIKARSQTSAEDVRLFDEQQQAFAIDYHECTKVSATIQHSTEPEQSIQQLIKKRQSMEADLSRKVAVLMELRLKILDNFKRTTMLIHKVNTRIIDDELIHWKREQQLSGNGIPFNSNLDQIQDWCETLADLIWQTRQQIKHIERLKEKLALDPPGVADIVPSLSVDLTQLLSSLVTATFIIEKQPPQVMKTNTRFAATIRLLVGGKLNVHMNPPHVKVTIISESQANQLLKNDRVGKGGESSGEILNNTGSMEYQQATKQLSVSFRNMQLRKIKRAEKKGTESVMDEKFSLLFQSQFSIGGGELVFQVWTLSLPVVVIVHGNQEPHAWATITWDNAFSEPGRCPFQVPDKVPWHKMKETLSQKFLFATGKKLSDENLSYLADKIFRGTFHETTNYMLSWAQFCKENLCERTFTFWEWFFAILKLTKEHLKGPWIDGSIMGFVKKKTAEDMLSQCPAGTFLLRFSDSELGGITIAWVSETKEVFSLQPFTARDFSVRCLGDRIRDLNQLTTLYPLTPKEDVFGKYYTPIQDQHQVNGYVKPMLVTQVLVPCNNNTPQHNISYMSPDASRDTPSVASSYGGSVTTNATTSASNLDMDYLNPFDEAAGYSADIDINSIDFMMNYNK